MKMTRNGPADLPRHQVENRVEPVNPFRDAKLLLARPRGVGYHSPSRRDHESDGTSLFAEIQR